MPLSINVDRERCMAIAEGIRSLCCASSIRRRAVSAKSLWMKSSSLHLAVNSRCGRALCRCSMRIFFRHVRTSVEVLGSLTVGVALMSGVAALLHLKINFFNFIVYPITFGIAVDYGANVAARVRERGRVLEALAEVGPAVALCSWTSIIGYGSLLISANRALRSFGEYAMIGEVTTILTALVLLPALLIIAERQRGLAAAEAAGAERQPGG